MNNFAQLESVDATADYVAARNEAVSGIAAKADALADAHRDLALQVAAQADQVDNIELNMQQTEAAVHEATRSVRDVAASQKTTTQRLGKLGVGAAVGGALGLFLGPLGSVAGAAAGAFVANKAHETLSDPNREAYDFESSRHWQTTDACFNCHAAFNAIRRVHHCRRCGKSFCNACSQFRHPVPIAAVPQYTEPVRVCGDCFTLQAVADRQSS